MRKGLICFGTVLFLAAGCGEKKQPGPAAETAESVQEISELDRFRNDLAGTGSPAAFAWAGTEGLAGSELAEAYPFVLDIPAERIVRGPGDDLFVIVPADPKCSVTIYSLAGTGRKRIFDSRGGEPVAVYAGRDDRKTEVRLTLPDSTVVRIVPELVSGKLYDEGSVSVIENFTVSVPAPEPSVTKLMAAVSRVLMQVPKMQYWYSEGELEVLQKNDDEMEAALLEDEACRIISFGHADEQTGELIPVRTFAAAEESGNIYEYHQAGDYWYRREMKEKKVTLEEVREDLQYYGGLPAAFAYLGENGIDPAKSAGFDFLAEMGEDRIAGSGPEYYLVIPADEAASVTVLDVSYDPEGVDVYHTENGEPFILRTSNENAAAPLTVGITAPDGKTVTFRPLDTPGDLLAEDGESVILNLASIDQLGLDIGAEAAAEAVLAADAELAEFVDAGMTYLFDRHERIDIDWHPCQIISFGTDHDEMFVRERIYAVSEDIRHVYEYDAVNDAWYEPAAQQ